MVITLLLLVVLVMVTIVKTFSLLLRSSSVRIGKKEEEREFEISFLLLKSVQFTFKLKFEIV